MAIKSMLKLKNTIVLCLSPFVLIVVDGKVVFIKAVVDLVEEQCLSPETQPVFCLYTSNKKHFLFFTFWWSLKALFYCHMLYPSFKLYLEINKVAFHILLTFMSAVFKRFYIFYSLSFQYFIHCIFFFTF